MKPADKTEVAIEREASDWLVSRSAGVVSLADDAAFKAWLARDPRHAAAYGALEATWDDIGAMAHLADLAPRDAMPTPTKQWFALRRAVPVVGAVVVAVAALSATILTSGQGSGEGVTYASGLGEIRQFSLADGSRVTLGARSSLTVSLSKAQRHVALTRGEAFFEVAKDPARPFIVEADGAQVRVVGTKFDVHRGADRVRVAVVEGVVEVRPPAPLLSIDTPLPALLNAGERTEVAARAPVVGVSDIERPKIERAEATRAAAWREGRLVFDNVPLSELVNDVNRYYAPGIRLGTGEVGALRVTASFRAREVDRMIKTLEAALPVVAVRDADGRITLNSASR